MGDDPTAPSIAVDVESWEGDLWRIHWRETGVAEPRQHGGVGRRVWRVSTPLPPSYKKGDMTNAR